MVVPSLLLLALLAAGGCSQRPLGPVFVPFDVPVDLAEGRVHGVSSLDARDINGDGRADVAVICGGKHAQGKHFSWYQAPAVADDAWVRHEFNPDAPLRSFLGAARLDDLDGDGDADLVVSSDHHSGDVRQCDVFVFENPLPQRPAADPWQYHLALENLPCHHINDMETADMDGDGLTDIVVRSLEPNEILILFQDSVNAWTRRIIPTQLQQSEGLAVGDLNGDGLPEITFTGYVLQAPARPRTQPYRRIAVDAGYALVNQNTKESIGDIDADGWPDLLLAPAEAFRGGKAHDLAWYRNPAGNLTSVWQRHVVWQQTNNIHTVRLADMNNDRLVDIVAGVAWGERSIRIFYNGGDGTFAAPQIVSDINGLYSGVVVDIDGDGDTDIVGQETYARNSRPLLYRSLLEDPVTEDGRKDP